MIFIDTKVLGVLTLVFFFLSCGSLSAEMYVSTSTEHLLEFITRFEGEEAPGRFSRFEAEVITEPGSALPISIRVTVDVTSATMGSPDLDDGISEPEWFDFSAYPQATFTSDHIRQAADAGYLADGELRLKDVSRKLKLSFDWQLKGERAVMSGNTEVSRLDFNIGTGEWSDTTSIAETVLVRFSLSLAEKPQ